MRRRLKLRAIAALRCHVATPPIVRARQNRSGLEAHRLLTFDSATGMIAKSSMKIADKSK